MNDSVHIETDSTELPLITFALFAYNQEQYIREAVEGAFAQTYSPLEIILSDDCSSDRTFEFMQEMVKNYSGSNIIKLNRNKKNIGLIAHVNKIFEIANGNIIVAAAGDDISMSWRTEKVVEAYKKAGKKPLLIHSSVINVDEDGNDHGVMVPPVIANNMTLEQIAISSALYIGATGVWSKHLYKCFGQLCFSEAYEDLVLGFRAALAGAILYIDEPLVKYRMNTGTSHRIRRTGDSIKRQLDERRKLNSVHLDVFRQRLCDLKTWNDTVDNHLNKYLHETFIRHLCRDLFYRSPVGLIKQLFFFDRKVAIEAAIDEARFLASLAKRYISKNFM